jgi:hypothetical protein
MLASGEFASSGLSVDLSVRRQVVEMILSTIITGFESKIKIKILPRISVPGISIKILSRIKNPVKDFC